MKKLKEEWVDIIGYEGYYQVSNYGQVRSIDRVIKTKNGKVNSLKGRILKFKIYHHPSGGYHYLRLSKHCSETSFKVHYLVARHFIGRSPELQSFINHKDRVKTNNYFKNLEWVTHRENISHNKKNKPNKQSKYTGVSKSSNGKKWVAYIYNGTKNVNLGSFDVELNAYKAYKKALDYYGVSNKYAP
jgi:hypothetical protein